jgi:hypothetical protein
MKIITHYWAKPIPERRYDWSAIHDGYDGEGHIGYGRTEAEAIADLERLDEEERESKAAERARYDYESERAQRGKDIARGLEER